MNYSKLWEKAHDPRVRLLYPVFKAASGERIVLKLWAEPGDMMRITFRRNGDLYTSTNWHVLERIPATEGWEIRPNAIMIQQKAGIYRYCGRGTKDVSLGVHWPLMELEARDDVCIEFTHGDRQEDQGSAAG